MRTTVERTCEHCGKRFMALLHETRRGWGKYCSVECYRQAEKPRRDLTQRFWEKVDKSAGPNACWIWLGGKDAKGYGFFGRTSQAGHMERAHRIAYELANGPVPDRLLVCHSCDNPSCVNPAHLWLGTNTDNMRDAKAKGRLAHGHSVNQGERNGSAKLATPDILAIRNLHSSGESMNSLAARFCVSEAAIRSVIHRKTWKHVL